MRFNLHKIFKKVSKGTELKEKVVNVFNPHKWFDTNDESRINIKVTQSLLFAFILSLCGNMFLMILIIIMLPLKEKIPTFVHFLPKEEQIVYVEEFKTNKKALKRVKEFLARDYIKKRETIDLVTEEKRYPYVYYLSSPEIAKEFDEQYNTEKNALSPFKLAVDNNQITSIRIISSAMLNANQVQVEFEATTSVKNTGKITLTEVVIAIVTFSEDTKNYKGSDYLNNPFGFVVSDYSLSVKERRESSPPKKENVITNYKKTEVKTHGKHTKKTKFSAFD